MRQVVSVAVCAVSILLLAFAVAGAARADTVRLSSGERMSGKITALDGDKITLKTEFAGSVAIDRKAVAAIATEEVVSLRLNDGTVLTGVIRTPDAGGMVMTGPLGGERRIALAEIDAFARGREAPRRFRWSGRANAGFSRTDGNSDTQSVNLNGEIRGRSKTNRIKIDGDYNRTTDGSEETTDDTRLRGKHDRFVDGKLYFYTNVGFARDDLADLRLRTNGGTGLGYQFLDGPRTSLFIEGGPSVLYDVIESADNELSAALRWAANLEHKVFGAAVFFHDHEGLFDLTSDNALLIVAKTGLRFPIAASFNVSAQVDLDYDSEPAAGVRSTDLKYILSLGYSW